MMSVTSCQAMSATVTGMGKRKRAVVNYAEPSDSMDLDIYVNMEAEEDEEISDDDVPEGDSVYGSRKKAPEQKAKKRTRFTNPRLKKPEKAFRFLDLPPELRDYIYELALVEPEGITVVSKTKAYRRTAGRGPVYTNDSYQRRHRRYYQSSQLEPIPQSADLSPNLLAVCKQIRAEGIGYLYKQEIILADTMSLHAFLAAIGPTNRLQLAEISVREWGDGRGTHKAMNFASLTLLASCTNLKKLNLDCNIGWLRQPKNLARQLFRDGHYFLEAYGAANGSKDAALEVLELGDGNYDESRSYWWRNKSIPEREKFEEEFDAEMRKLLGC